jgi:hypothetical protein
MPGMESAAVSVVIRPYWGLAACIVLACGEPTTPSASPEVAGAAGEASDGAAGAAPLPPSVELGVPSGSDGLSFASLVDGAELRLQTFGQGGTHIIVGVRCVGCGKRVFVSAELRNLATGALVEEPEPARPQLLYCEDGDYGACDLVPYLVHTSGLTESEEEKHGLRVSLTARARTQAGVTAHTSREIVLSTADL